MRWRMTRTLLVGATGLVGGLVMARADGRPLAALIRREVDLPDGVEALVGETAQWPAQIAAYAPDVLICCLGTTRRKAGSDAAFRAVDQDLVLACGAAAASAGARQMIVMTSVGASTRSKALYLNTKGWVEQGLSAMGFDRVDILRPGLLIGPRAERRVAEKMAQIGAPLTNLLMIGRLRKYRSIEAGLIADAIWDLVGEQAPGRFVYEHDELLALAEA